MAKRTVTEDNTKLANYKTALAPDQDLHKDLVKVWGVALKTGRGKHSPEVTTDTKMYQLNPTPNCSGDQREK